MSDQDPRSAALVGARLDGAYQLTRLVSEGGMGAVYEAVQLRLNRRVAVKVMAAELVEHEEALGRFRREVAVTAQLAHPHVVQLLDFGTTQAGQPYLVMEYLDGEDLGNRLARGALSLPGTIEIVDQIASALAAIHARGVVHRDLKPANVFLLPLEGRPDFVKLVDFGISKVRTAKTKLTRAFTVVGTPEFVSPEQAMGSEGVDARTDQWALACMTWLMLSGQLPFQGRTLNDLLQRIVNDPPPPLTVPGLPRAIEVVLRRALAKKKEERFSSVTAFAHALSDAAGLRGPLREGASGVVVAIPKSRGRGWLVAAGAALLLAAGAALVYRGSAAPPAAEPAAEADGPGENEKGDKDEKPKAAKRPRPAPRAPRSP